MPREITHHDRIIEAIGRSGILAELTGNNGNHHRYELDLELMVYGRTYNNKQAGPYMRLLVYGPGEEVVREGDFRGNTFYVLVEGHLDLYVKDERGQNNHVGKVDPQTSFGEVALLAGQPRSATVVVPAKGEATVLEIQRPALRLLGKLKNFGERLERNYREGGLNQILTEVQKATDDAFSQELLEQLKASSRFTVYTKDQMLFREGDALDKVIFINNGWVRRVREAPSGQGGRTRKTGTRALAVDMIAQLDREVGLDFMGAGNWLGLEALSGRNGSRWSYAATVMSRTEALEIAIGELRTNPALLKLISQEFPHFSEAESTAPEPPADNRMLAAMAREIGTGIIDGTNLLIMDMDRCIRCGNCSLACHKVHGQSRLLRRGVHIARPINPGGRSIQHVLAPSVCLHCQDPECLTGCPTGAISRFAEGDIDINSSACIGCAGCATQCPYNAISMVPRRESKPGSGTLGALSTLKSWLSLASPKEPDAVTATDDLHAIKCNLCRNTSLNPEGAKTAAYSCQENCPTGALVRVNPREYFSEAQRAIGIVFKDRTHAIGRNIHKRDTPAIIIHVIGVMAIVAIASTILLAARRYSLDGHLGGTWLTLRWLTGLLGLVSIASVMTYSVRRQIYTRRVGPLRYWKLAHGYLGVLAAVVLLIHGGGDSGGLLTTCLMISFDLTIVAGLFGATCYLLVPRILTSIEGDPLLIEDLSARREELRRQLERIDTSDDQLRHLFKERVRKRFFSFGYLLRQYVRRETLTKLLAEAREEFHKDAEELADLKARRSFMEAVEATATLRRVDSLIYLHQLLKIWLWPHVVSATVMLALMLVHIIQVLLFTVP